MKKMRLIRRKRSRNEKWARLKRQNEYMHSEINKLKSDLAKIQNCNNKNKDSY